MEREKVSQDNFCRYFGRCSIHWFSVFIWSCLLGSGHRLSRHGIDSLWQFFWYPFFVVLGRRTLWFDCFSATREDAEACRGWVAFELHPFVSGFYNSQMKINEEPDTSLEATPINRE
jgi:hypothetical protein